MQVVFPVSILHGALVRSCSKGGPGGECQRNHPRRARSNRIVPIRPRFLLNHHNSNTWSSQPCGQHTVSIPSRASHSRRALFRRSSADFRLHPCVALTFCPARDGSAHQACRCRRWIGLASHDPENHGCSNHPGSTYRARSTRHAESHRGWKSEVEEEGVWHCPAMAAAGAQTASRAARQNGAHHRGIHPAARCDDHAAGSAGGSRGSERCVSGIRG